MPGGRSFKVPRGCLKLGNIERKTFSTFSEITVPSAGKSAICVAIEVFPKAPFVHVGKEPHAAGLPSDQCATVNTRSDTAKEFHSQGTKDFTSSGCVDYRDSGNTFHGGAVKVYLVKCWAPKR